MDGVSAIFPHRTIDDVIRPVVKENKCISGYPQINQPIMSISMPHFGRSTCNVAYCIKIEGFSVANAVNCEGITYT